MLSILELELQNTGREISFGRMQWRTGGAELGGLQPPKIPKALLNRAKPNPIVKTVKNC